ncbi:maternal B9.15 protein-like [Panonychus citri]|uniref:maternal B9.15 protein-like n=1 Tax=Panonychus citri TaxID=50023 RepID=UPI002307BAF6|nr:maternal B9.15 protein-like [Panonychus citri]
MREEIEAAVIFLVRLIGKSNALVEENLIKFQDNLVELLAKKYENHWFPEKPNRGQAYRCIRVNESDRRDTILEIASKMSGINYDDLSLPVELTLWVDPKEVTCRFGEHEGSYCVIACFKDGKSENISDKITIDAIEKEYLKKSKQNSYEFNNTPPQKKQVTMNRHDNKNFGKNLTNSSPGVVPVSTSSGYSNRLVSNSNTTEFYTNQLNCSPHHFTNSPPHQSAPHRSMHHPQSLLDTDYHQSTISPLNHSLGGLPYQVSPADFANQANNANNTNSNLLCGKFSRSVRNTFNNVTFPTDTFQTLNDRYYWKNKMIVKA